MDAGTTKVRKMRILAVDDEPGILELLKVYLEAEDAHEVVTATSGADALAAIEKADADFECLLLDIQMPQMNGIALVEHIRSMPDYVHVPIIMLTAMSQRSYIDKAFAVGATDYITKPFDFIELRSRLQAAGNIVMEFNRAREDGEIARRLIRDMGKDVKTDPAEAFSLDGVDGVIGNAAFENYVLALSRGKLLFATTFALRIAEFADLHRVLSSRELRSTLKTVAEVIAENMREPGNLVTYRGNGVFLCICHRRPPVPVSERELQINAELAEAGPPLPGREEIQVIAGRDVSLVSISRAGALLALRKAVEAIETPAQPAREAATLSKRILRNQSRTPEERKLDRRGYELVLEDIVREERRQAH